MRLPTLPGKSDSEIDIGQVIKMADLYLERGFSYFDTAFGYHGGKSEEAIRLALTERYERDKFQVTTKIPVRGMLSADEMKKMTQTSLDRTGLDYFNLYFLHGIGRGRLEMLDETKAWDYLKGVKESGKAKNIGFSFHGDADTLNRILDIHGKDLDIVQLQINYLDWDDEEVQSRKCYEAAVAHGMGVTVMEPIKGGSLANFTPAVAEIFKRANPDVSVASWALRFPMALDGVVTVLSGMSAIEQVDDNTRTADTMGPLTGAEMAVIAEAMAALQEIPTIPCTACRYCVDDCPQSINTPAILGLLNEYTKYQNLTGARRSYGMITGGGQGGAQAKSSDCQACGTCEERCPQNINIIELHKEAVRLFE